MARSGVSSTTALVSRRHPRTLGIERSHVDRLAASMTNHARRLSGSYSCSPEASEGPARNHTRRNTAPSLAVLATPLCATPSHESEGCAPSLTSAANGATARATETRGVRPSKAARARTRRVTRAWLVSAEPSFGQRVALRPCTTMEVTTQVDCATLSLPRPRHPWQHAPASTLRRRSLSVRARRRTHAARELHGHTGPDRAAAE
jgi:hypothetical protein